LEREQHLSSTTQEKAGVSFVLSAKQKELERIKKTQQSLKTKLASLLHITGCEFCK
jgi:hypothetical protein